MSRRQPLYPHIPKMRRPVNPLERDEVKLRFLPDSPEVLTQTVRAIGYRDKLDNVFQQAIARAKGLR